MPTPEVLSQYYKLVLDKGRAMQIAISYAKTKFFASTLMSIICYAQFELSGAFRLPCICATRNGPTFSLPLPEKMWHATYKVWFFRLPHECDINISRPLVICTLAHEMNRRDTRCCSWFPCKFITKVTVSLHHMKYRSISTSAMMSSIVSQTTSILPCTSMTFGNKACHVALWSGV